MQTPANPQDVQAALNNPNATALATPPVQSQVPQTTNPPSTVDLSHLNNTSDTNNLTQPPTTNSDIQGLLMKNLNNQDTFFQNLSQLQTTPQAMVDLQNKQAQYDSQVQQASGQAQGLINPNNQAIPLEFLQGQGREKLFQAQQNQAINASLLNYAQGNRTYALQAASTIFDASKNNVQNILDVLTKTAPQNIGNPIVDKNGNATQVVRNPIDGTESTLQLGNVGQPQGQYTTGVIGTHYDPLTNAQVPSYGIINTSTGTFQPIAGAPMPDAPYPNYQSGSLDSSLPASNPGSVQIPPTQSSTPNGQQQLAFINNNPGNLRFASQPGATQGVGGFAKFSSPEAGYQALVRQVQLDQSRNMDLGTFISKYAPPSENNTQQYVQQAQSSLGVNFATPLNQIPADRVAAFIAQKESGTRIATQNQSSENLTVSAAKQAIGQTFTNLKDSIQNTYFGHAFIDTSQVDQKEAQNAAQLYGQGVVKAFDPVTNQNIKSINTSMSNISSLEPLIAGLPTDPMDPQRVVNYFNQKLGTDPTLAKLNSMWQAVLPDLQAQIGTQGISRLATGFLSNPDLSITPSVTSVRDVAQAMLDQTRVLLNNRENSIFGGPPPPPNPTSFNNTVIGNAQTVDPSMNIVNSILGGGTQGTQLNQSNLPSIGGGGLDLNKALALGGLS